MKATISMKLAAAAMLATLASTTALAQYSITWSTIDGGGATFSTGGDFRLGGTIGQPDAGPGSTGMSNGNFTLVGGFWAIEPYQAPCDPCDVNCNGTVNQFDIPPFVVALQTHTGCSPCAGDTNLNGTINTFDIEGFLDCLIP